MNGNYHISEEAFKKMPPDERDWIFFSTFNEYRSEVDARICKLESRKWFNAAASAVGGFIGGVATVIGKWVFFKP